MQALCQGANFNFMVHPKWQSRLYAVAPGVLNFTPVGSPIEYMLLYLQLAKPANICGEGDLYFAFRKLLLH